MRRRSNNLVLKRHILLLFKLKYRLLLEILILIIQRCWWKIISHKLLLLFWLHFIPDTIAIILRISLHRWIQIIVIHTRVDILLLLNWKRHFRSYLLLRCLSNILNNRLLLLLLLLRLYFYKGLRLIKAYSLLKLNSFFLNNYWLRDHLIQYSPTLL